jgi:hypothetical protein
VYVNFRLQGAKKNELIFLSCPLIRTPLEFSRKHQVKVQLVQVTAERTEESITDVTARIEGRELEEKRRERNILLTQIVCWRQAGLTYSIWLQSSKEHA